MNKEIDEIFKQWKEFLSWCYETNDKTTEIHRDNLERVMAYTRQLENIIKEVREYIKQTGQYLEDIKRFKVDVLEPDYLNLLEILDKENN